MKLAMLILGLFFLLGLFLFIWYHVERMQDELEQLNRSQHQDES